MISGRGISPFGFKAREACEDARKAALTKARAGLTAVNTDRSEKEVWQHVDAIDHHNTEYGSQLGALGELCSHLPECMSLYLLRKLPTLIKNLKGDATPQPLMGKCLRDLEPHCKCKSFSGFGIRFGRSEDAKDLAFVLVCYGGCTGFLALDIWIGEISYCHLDVYPF